MSADPYSTLFALAAALDDRAASGGLGDETPPDREPLHFVNEHALTFIQSPGEVTGEPGEGPIRLETALFGLLGPIGPMPYFYSEIVARTERDNETALRDFLGILSHRAASLMYRAWRKHRVHLERQPHARRSVQGRYSQLVAALTGSSDMPDRIAWLDVARSRPPAAPDLFLRRVRNAKGLRQLLQRQFAMDFEVEEFVGAWESLPEDARSALGGSRRPVLGRNTLLGRRVWQVQSTFSVVVRHPTPQQYALLRPGSDSLRRIQIAIRMYCTAELAFRLRIIVRGGTLTAGSLGGGEGAAMLGWNTVAGAPDPDRDYVFSICRDYNAKRMAQ